MLRQALRRVRRRNGGVVQAFEEGAGLYQGFVPCHRDVAHLIHAQIILSRADLAPGDG